MLKIRSIWHHPKHHEIMKIKKRKSWAMPIILQCKYSKYFCCIASTARGRKVHGSKRLSR